MIFKSYREYGYGSQYGWEQGVVILWISLAEARPLMTAPYRKPSDNPHISQAVEALKRAEPMLDLLRENATQHAGEIAAELLLDAGDVHNTEDEERLAIVDQSHAALWTALNEARDLMTRAGLDVGATAATRHAPKTDTTTPAQILNQLKYLLPNVDFSVRLDDEAEAYIAAQRRSKKLWLPLGLVLGAIPALVILLLKVCT